MITITGDFKKGKEQMKEKRKENMKQLNKLRKKLEKEALDRVSDKEQLEYLRNSSCISEEVIASYELSIDDVGMNIWSNAQYWLDALRMFKAFKYKEIELKLYDKMRPFTLGSPDKKGASCHIALIQ